MQVLIINLALTLAVVARSVNIFTADLVWILLFAAMSILIILALYMIKERSNIRQRQESNKETY
jgi:hypothetical protein